MEDPHSDRPEDLTARLRGAGYVPEPRETVLIGLAGQQAGRQAGPVPQVSIRSTDTADDMPRIAAMESEVWHRTGAGWPTTWSGACATGKIAVFVAEVGDEVASSAWLVFKPGTEFAGLWGGATLAGWRGQGIYRALVARRADIAAARGVRYLQVDASDDSRPILERLGFVAITTTTPYVWDPAECGKGHGRGSRSSAGGKRVRGHAPGSVRSKFPDVLRAIIGR